MQTFQIDAESLEDQPTAVLRTSLAVADIPAFLGRAYMATSATLAKAEAGPAGPPFARYHVVGDGRFEVEAGFPATKPIAPDGEVQPGTLPGGDVATTMYIGPYEGMEPAYAALNSWIAERGEPAGDPWEIYYDDPDDVPDPASWRTRIVAPYRPVRASG